MKTKAFPRHLGLSIALAVFLPAMGWGTFSINTAWSVKTGGTAGDVNGGGFTRVTGAKDVTAATDLAVDASNNKKVTSVTHTFVSGDVGKYIDVTAGVNWQLTSYQILSVSGGAAVLDRSPSVVGQTGGTYDLYAGVDYSQDDAAKQAYTDLVIGATTTQGTSVARPFVADDVGNIVNVVSGTGCTVQRVQINSVAAGIATFSASLGTAASTCTGNLGGALLTIAGAMALVDTANQIIWIQSGTYTLTATVQFPSSTNRSVSVIGYQTYHWDMGTKPLITTATDSTTLFNTSSADYPMFLMNVSLSNTASIRAQGISSSGGGSFPGIIVVNSVLDGFTNAVDLSTVHGNRQGNIYLYGVEIKNCSSDGVVVGADFSVLDSYIHNNTGNGILAYDGSGSRFIIGRSIVANNGGRGFYSSYSQGISLILHSNVFSGNGASGVTLTGVYFGGGGYLPIQVTNNIFYGNTGYGLENPGTAPAWFGLYGVFGPNAYGANTSGNVYHFQQSMGTPDIELGASPFTSSTDFSLNSTANGGALLKKTGFPGTFPGGLSVGYLDVGAVQTSGSPASAGTRAY
jgi:hypothetical protein